MVDETKSRKRELDMEIMIDKEIEKKVELEFRMDDFTKYINRKLREHEMVEDWSFVVGVVNENTLQLTIDYCHSFHSRDIYDMEMYDFDELKRMFDFYFNKRLEELRAQYGMDN